MFKCSKCGRDFKRKCDLTRHLKFCGNYKIFLDGGYECYIGSNGKRIYIHREVLEKKLGRKLKKDEIAHHKDHNKRNNDPDNIELKTESSHGLHHYKSRSDKEKLEQRLHLKKQFGENNGQSKLTKNDVKTIRELLENGSKGSELAQQYKVDETLISQIKHYKIWKHI